MGPLSMKGVYQVLSKVKNKFHSVLSLNANTVLYTSGCRIEKINIDCLMFDIKIC